MPFFSESGFNYTQKKNGTIDRVCIESVMATEFLNDWKSSPEDIATYLKQNAIEEHFDNLEDTVERLEKVVNGDIGELFDKKDAFIYFSVFARFKKTGLDDFKFVEFLTEYAQSLHNEFEEIEYDKDNNKKRSTKDKYVVINKINIVDKLMREYLNIRDEDIKEIDCIEFVKSNVEDTTDEDVELYEEVLDDLTLNVDNNSKLLDKHNRPSLLALVGYSVKNDIDLDEWIVEFFRNNTTYILNQVENYKMMLSCLQKRKVA